MASRKVLADTSVLAEFLRKQNKENSILWKIKDNKTTVFVSSVTVFEIYFGATTPKHKKEADELFSTLEVINFSEKEAKKSAFVMNHLKSKNRMIEFRDVFIASCALANRLKIATINKKAKYGQDR